MVDLSWKAFICVSVYFIESQSVLWKKLIAKVKVTVVDQNLMEYLLVLLFFLCTTDLFATKPGVLMYCYW